MSCLSPVSQSPDGRSFSGDLHQTVRRALVISAVALAAIGLVAIFAQVGHAKELINLLKPLNWESGISLTLASSLIAFLLSIPDLLSFCSKSEKTGVNGEDVARSFRPEDEDRASSESSSNPSFEASSPSVFSSENLPAPKREEIIGPKNQKKFKGSPSISSPQSSLERSLKPSTNKAELASSKPDSSTPKQGGISSPTEEKQPAVAALPAKITTLDTPKEKQPQTLPVEELDHYIEVAFEVSKEKKLQNTPLLESPFYLGEMDGKTAEKLVKNPKTPGTWFLRYSTKQNDYCFTYLDPNEIPKHSTLGGVNQYEFEGIKIEISNQTSVKDFFKSVEKLITSGRFKSLAHSSGWKQENHLMSQPLGYTPYCLGYGITKKEIEKKFADSKEGAWCLRRSRSTKGAYVLCVKKGNKVNEYKTLNELTLNASLAAILSHYELKISDYVDCKVKVEKFTIDNQEISLFKSKREALAGLSQHKYVIRETRHGDYFLGYQDELGKAVFKLIAYKNLKGAVDLDPLLDDLKKDTFVPPILGLVNPPSVTAVEKKCPYPRQLILNLGSGNTQNALISKNNARYGNSTTIESVDLRHKPQSGNVGAAVKKLQPGNRVYLIGHGGKGDHFLSSDQFDIYYVQNFVDFFKKSGIQNNQEPLVISVVACYAGCRSPDGSRPSFCEELSRALDREHINAIVYGRTGGVMRWIGEDPNRYRKLVRMDGQTQFQHKGKGSKIRFTTKEGVHSQHSVYDAP